MHDLENMPVTNYNNSLLNISTTKQSKLDIYPRSHSYWVVKQEL